jgi:hypothetical protein
MSIVRKEIPVSKTVTALQATEETRRILDQVLIRTARMTPADRNILVLALRQTARELDLASAKIEQGRAPSELSELAGLPSNLAFLATIAVLTNDPEMVRRFDAFVDAAKQAAKAA